MSNVSQSRNDPYISSSIRFVYRCCIVTAVIGVGLATFHWGNKFNEEGRHAALANAGFHGISPLREDRQRVWHGTAILYGRLVAVSVDFDDHIVVDGRAIDDLPPS